MIQIVTHFSVPHHGPPPPRYPPFSNFGPDYDPDAIINLVTVHFYDWGKPERAPH